MGIILSACVLGIIIWYLNNNPYWVYIKGAKIPYVKKTDLVKQYESIMDLETDEEIKSKWFLDEDYYNVLQSPVLIQNRIQSLIK